MAFSHDGSLLAGFETDLADNRDTSNTSLVVWDLTTATVRHRSERRVIAGDRLAFSPDGKRLAMTFGKGSKAGTEYWLQCFDVSANRALFEKKLDFVPNGLAFAADSKEMILGHHDWKRRTARLVRLDELGAFRSETVFPPELEAKASGYNIRLAPLGNVMQIGSTLYSMEPIRMLGPILKDGFGSKISAATKGKVPVRDDAMEECERTELSEKGDRAYCVVRFGTGPSRGNWHVVGGGQRCEIQYAFAIDLRTQEVRYLGSPCNGTVSPDFQWYADKPHSDSMVVEPYGE